MNVSNASEWQTLALAGGSFVFLIYLSIKLLSKLFNLVTEYWSYLKAKPYRLLFVPFQLIFIPFRILGAALRIAASGATTSETGGGAHSHSIQVVAATQDAQGSIRAHFSNGTSKTVATFGSNADVRLGGYTSNSVTVNMDGGRGSGGRTTVYFFKNGQYSGSRPV